MSDTTNITDDASRPEAPSAIRWASYAAAVQIGAALVYALMLFALSGSLRREIIKANHDAKTPKVLCSVQNVKGCLDVNRAVHSEQIFTLLGSVVISAVLVIFLRQIRKGTRSGRIVYIAFSVLGQVFGFVGTPLALVAIGANIAGAFRVSIGAAAIASVFAIVLLLRPAVGQYFDAVSPRASSAAVRPGFGSLFRPRPPLADRAPAAASAGQADQSAQEQAAARSAKAKSRSDAEAIARGAELARTRAKAAKSRRPE